jgi:hypothetical protein
MNNMVLQKAEYFSTNWITVIFPRRSMFHSVSLITPNQFYWQKTLYSYWPLHAFPKLISSPLRINASNNAISYSLQLSSFTVTERRGRVFNKLRFLWFFSVPPGECRDSNLKLGYNRSIPNPFHFIIHLSPFHSTLYTLRYWISVVN